MSDRLRKRLRSDDGFTLIELLIVIIILGVLAGIVVFAVGGLNDTSKTSACKADKKTVQTAVEAFYADAQPHAYPTSWGNLTSGGGKYLSEASTMYEPAFTATDGTVSAISGNPNGCT